MQIIDQTVEDFLNKIEPAERQADARELVHMMHTCTGETPHMWGSSIIGFGTMHYKYESGREGDTVIVGFAPRKQEFVLYGVVYYELNAERAKELGKHKTGKGCLYIKRLSDVNLEVLKDMIIRAYEYRKAVS